MSHAPPETSAFTSTDSRADVSHLHAPASSTCLHAHTCPLHMTSSSITPVWPGPTWKSNPVRTACKKKKKSFDQVELWLWPKSQNFQKWPVPFSFLSTFRFWDPFLHLKLGNCANGPIPKKLTFAQILTKKSKFSRSTCLAQFFA